jgi:type IV secretory pathway TrbD component
VRERDLIEGYEATIHQGLWKRILMLWAPRMWTAIWLVVNAYALLMLLTVYGLWYAVLPILIWPLGHGLLVALTLWDVQFDDVLLAALRYGSHYEAG